MSRRVAAADLGKSSAKLLVGTVAPGGVVIESSDIVVHEGRPLEALASWYTERRVARCAGLAVTGLYGDEVAAPALASLPEDACLASALDLLPGLAGAQNLVSVGARGYSVLTRDPEGRVQFVENDKCSGGTGETMLKMAARFGLAIEEADRIAAEAAGAIAITARCSVFAKSEMTHFANQGEPADRLFRGYFDSIARYVAAMLARIRVPGPVTLVGGGSRLRTLRICLAEHAGCEVGVLDQGVVLEAIGALGLAAEHAASSLASRLPDDPALLLRPHQRRAQTLAPAREHAHRVTRMRAAFVAEGEARRPCIMGLDLGSTGSKAVLTSLQSGELVLDVYDRTQGNPVEAAQRLVAALLERSALDVRAIGVTGSGREAVATVLRAAYPDAGERIVVLNEIVAHATAAIRCDEHRGKSLSVVEIGGQDAKFIRIADGHIVESAMNKACSAGTGSFLEEQALLYGARDIDEFTRQAREADSPPDLGQMCTVFVADAAAQARAQGFTIGDLFAGFQYSVIHNYLNRVMGQRSFGDRVFFQGKPASGESLAWTLAAVSGRDVVVPPNPGAMGAWGVGLCAIDQLGQGALKSASVLDLSRILQARVESKQEFRCEDKTCRTLCRIERSAVAVGGTRQTVFSGGACPKFEVLRIGRTKLAREAPNAFDERDALLEGYRAPVEGRVVVGIPQVGPLAGWLPWVVTFVRELGLGVRVFEGGAKSLARGEELCTAYDSCAPMKLAHAIADEPCDAVFFPRMLDIFSRGKMSGRTCATEQGMPLVIRQALAVRGSPARIVSPVVSFEDGLASPSLLAAAAEAARELGAPPQLAPMALQRAAEAQESYERELAAIGARTIAYGRATRTPVVVVCGALHVIHDHAINAGIPGIVRQDGALPLPMDCYPPEADLEPLEPIAWADARHAVRVALAARRAGDIYPLWLSSFGCGPASFVEQVFDHLMNGFPHTCIESDGHGGSAGFVTRVQAFLHGVRQHDRRPSPAAASQLRAVRPAKRQPSRPGNGGRVVMFPLADGLGELVAASYRSLGHDAVAAGPNTSKTFAMGRRDCSGKECLPYQLIWGAFRAHLEERPPEGRVTLIQVAGHGACRNCMFTTKDRISLERLGHDERVEVRPFGEGLDGSAGFLGVFFSTALAWDVLHGMTSYYGAIPEVTARVDSIGARYQAELLALAERRRPDGLRGLWPRARQWRDTLALVERASDDFAELAAQHDDGGGRTVLLTGDIYVRLDAFASDGLVRALNRRRLRVLVDPASVIVEYLGLGRSRELIGLPDGPIESQIHTALMRRMRRRIYGVVRERHPWMPMPDAARMLERARPIIDSQPVGEAPITVGSVLDAWAERTCDGVVLANPWGCGPSLVAEGLLRTQREIPMLFVYNDGSPLDERRLSGFAHRLHRQPARVAFEPGKEAAS